MKSIWIPVVALAALAGPAQAQSYRRFHDELFCHDMGYYTTLAMQDFRNGVPLEMALARDDGYLCTDESEQICAIKRNELKSGTKLVYSQLGPQADLRSMDAAKFLRFADMATTGTVKMCMDAVRNRR